VIAPGYQPVTLVKTDGTRIRGEKKNEDAYSIQIMDTREQLQGYRKSELREVIAETRSLMPDFTAERVSEGDFRDVLGYLGRMRGTAPSEAANTFSGGISARDLLDGLKNPGRWLQYSGDYTGKRHSPLTQITPQNVSQLKAQWAFQADTLATTRGLNPRRSSSTA